jgi:hypothetical protein
MSSGRMRQRAVQRAGVAQTSGFATLLRGFQNLHDSDAQAFDQNFLKWFDYVHCFSGRLQPKSSLRTTYNTKIGQTRALNPNTKFYGYSICYEQGGQIRAIASVNRVNSGSTTLTVNTCAMTDNLTAAAPDGSTNSGNVLLYFQAGTPEAAYNGTWASGGNGATSFTVTISGGTALAGPTGTTNCNGSGLAASTATLAYDCLNKWKDNPTWLLYKRGSNGRMVAWSTSFYAFNMNLLESSSTADGGGLRWPAWHAQYMRTNLFDSCDLQGVFVDNYMDPREDIINDVAFPGGSGSTNRKTYDFLADGSGQLITAASVLTGSTKFRQGHVNYSTAHRSLSVSPASGKSANLRIMGNHDSANSATLTGEYAGDLDEVYYENVFNNFTDAGRVASGINGSSSGFLKYFSPSAGVGSIQIAAAGGRLKTGGKVILGIQCLNWTNLEVLRFGICMAWLHDIAVPMLCPRDGLAFGGGGVSVVPDEFKVALGTALDTIPLVPFTVASGLNGLWARRYTNGVVLLNNHTAAIDYDCTSTLYQRITGTLDPTVNSGGGIINGLFSVPAASGRVLLINDPGL